MSQKRPHRASEPPQPIRTYGCPLVLPNQFLYDSFAFARRTPIDKGAPTRIELFRRISDVLLPGHFEWHDWTERVVESLCHNSLVAFPGCSNSAKTFNVASFACVWWLADPDESSVMFVSTSIKSLRRRGWSEIQKCHTSIPGPRIGNFVDSKMIWQIKKGDDKHAIIGKAVEEGSVTKVADDIKGVHTKRQMIIIDEATAVPDAIWDACTNLYSYPDEFIIVAMANPRSRMERFAKFMEPEGGWTSVTVDSEEWDGKPQIEYGGRIVRVVRFDAEKSPNIKEGRIVSRHLPKKEEVEAARKAAGGEHSPLYWSNIRGFPPPEGLTKTVFTESALERNKGYIPHIFTGKNFTIIGAFDHARDGGDRPALRFAKLGEIDGGKWGIEVMPPAIIPTSAIAKDPIDYQLSKKVQKQCESFEYKGQTYSCPPENLGVDATGAGAGFCDTIQRLWSSRVMRIQFGGTPSEDPCSPENIRPANEVYRNKRAEMYFRSRDALDHGQLKGIDSETASELCSILFDDSNPNKIVIEKKDDYKKRCRKSPDFADSLVIIIEVARRLGFRLSPLGETANKEVSWKALVSNTQQVYVDVNYSEDEEYELEPAL